MLGNPDDWGDGSALGRADDPRRAYSWELSSLAIAWLMPVVPAVVSRLAAFSSRSAPWAIPATDDGVPVCQDVFAGTVAGRRRCGRPSGSAAANQLSVRPFGGDASRAE
jgi:hypothetical protein